MRWARFACLGMPLGVSCYSDPKTDSPEPIASEEVIEQQAPVLSMDAPEAGQADVRPWPLRLDQQDLRVEYFQGDRGGWGAIAQQDVGKALRKFSVAYDEIDALDEQQGNRVRRGLARAHLELAATLRFGALASAYAYLYSFQPGPRLDSDPVEVDYLLGVSHGVLGNCDQAASSFDALPLGTRVDAQVAVWREWVQSDACPSDSAPDRKAMTADNREVHALFPGYPGPVQPGERPSVGSLPHYAFAYQGEDGTMPLSDPSTLLFLAEWHTDAAKQVAPPGEVGVVDALASLSRLPKRAAKGKAGDELALGWLWFGLNLSGRDIDFLNQAMSLGLSAVDEWSGRSYLADVMQSAQSDGGLLQEHISSVSLDLRSQVLEYLQAQEGENSDHPILADMIAPAILRASLRVNDATDSRWHEEAGKMGIALYSRTWDGDDHLHFAQFQSEWAAWQTANRDMRSRETVHRLAEQEFPEFEAVRLAVTDTLDVRVQSNSVNQGATQ